MARKLRRLLLLAVLLVLVSCVEGEVTTAIEDFSGRSLVSISGDGRDVFYAEPPAGGGDRWAVVHDRQAGTTVQHGPVGYRSLTDNGRYLAYVESVSSGTFGDVRLKDLETGVDVAVTDGANGQSYRPFASEDGRYVVFDSSASNLVPGDANGSADTVVVDLVAGATRLVTHSAGYPVPSVTNLTALSDDGRYALMYLDYPPLGLRGNAVLDVVTGQVLMNDSTDPDGPAVMSGDGRHVAFSTVAALEQGDTNLEPDVYVWDRTTDSYHRITDTDDGILRVVGVSRHGHYIAFGSSATNVVPDDTNGQADLFLWVRDGTTTRIATAQGGFALFNQATMSADGGHVAFVSGTSLQVWDRTN